MRKSKIRFTEIDDKVLASISADPEKFFNNLEELSIQIPDWSKLLFVVLSLEKKIMDVSFFEEAKEFFLSYTKRVLRSSSGSLDFICFSKELSDEWRFFSPPTLIGTNLTTKLRKKQ